MLHNFYLEVLVQGAMFRPTGQVISVNVFTHIVAAAVRIVTPEMPRYIWAKIYYW
jgi:hypothetical protein